MTPATNARMSIDTGKSRRGRPRVDSEDVSARMERGMLDAVDAWIAAQPEPRPRRSEAIRRLVAEALGMPAAVKGVAPSVRLAWRLVEHEPLLALGEVPSLDGCAQD